MKIKQSIVEKAWVNWVDAHFGLDCEEVMERFCKLIDPGDKNAESIDPWTGEEDEITVLPEIAERLHMLSGPHYRTYVRAHYVKHPWEKP